jgi:hypothetical protein
MGTDETSNGPIRKVKKKKDIVTGHGPSLNLRPSLKDERRYYMYF